MPWTPRRATLTGVTGEGSTAGEGAVIELDVGPPAHGGHCVARTDGRVVFVRHALPGERVRARLTEAGAGRRFWRADAVEILDPAADRVPSAWPEAGPGGVGGGELAHVALPAQRRWKARVVSDTLRRIGGVQRDVEVEAVPGDDARGGLGWRTRVELTADARGRAGMFRHRSHEVLALEDMPLAAPAIAELGLLRRRWRPGTRIEAVAPVGGDRALVLADGEPVRGTRRSVREVVTYHDRRAVFRVWGGGFWQVHDRAPRILVEAVLEALGLGPRVPGSPDGAWPGAPSHVLDLYAGAGLFAVPIAAALGGSGRVDAVEADPRGVRDARRNVHGVPQVVLHEGAVDRVLPGLGPAGPHAVVLDPPRAGAGRAVMASLLGRCPDRVVYVACDPAALARDLAAAAEHGYRLRSLRTLDLFPHTHHVECVAVLGPR